MGRGAGGQTYTLGPKKQLFGKPPKLGLGIRVIVFFLPTKVSRRQDKLNTATSRAQINIFRPDLFITYCTQNVFLGPESVFISQSQVLVSLNSPLIYLYVYSIRKFAN